jgi:uncharacterized protein
MKMPRPLAVITGASSGIGAAYAERLAIDGYDLILVARRRERLVALAEKLRRTGAEAEPLAADLTDADALSQLELQVTNDRLALLVNNAGFGGYRRFVDVEPRIIDELIGIHVRAIARLTRAALPGMVRRGNGAVVNVSSILALSGSLAPDPLPYRKMPPMMQAVDVVAASLAALAAHEGFAFQALRKEHCSNVLRTPGAR